MEVYSGTATKGLTGKDSVHLQEGWDHLPSKHFHLPQHPNEQNSVRKDKKKTPQNSHITWFLKLYGISSSRIIGGSGQLFTSAFHQESFERPVCLWQCDWWKPNCANYFGYWNSAALWTTVTKLWGRNSRSCFQVKMKLILIKLY